VADIDLKKMAQVIRESVKSPMFSV